MSDRTLVGPQLTEDDEQPTNPNAPPVRSVTSTERTLVRPELTAPADDTVELAPGLMGRRADPLLQAGRSLLGEAIRQADDQIGEDFKLQSIDYMHAMTGTPKAELYNNYEYYTELYSGRTDLEPATVMEASRVWWRNSTLALTKNSVQGELYSALERGDSAAAAAAAERIRGIERQMASQDVLTGNAFANNFLKPAIDNLALMLDPMLQGATVGMGAGIGVQTALAFATGGTSLLPTALTTALVATASTAAGTAVKSSEIMRNETIWNLYQLEDPEGNRIDPRLATGIAAVVGGLNGLVESVQLAQLVPGGEQLFRGATNRLVERLFANRFFQNRAINAVVRYGVNVTDEAIEEGIQESVNIIAEALAQDIANNSGASFDKDGFQENAARVLEAFSQGWRASAILAGPSNIIQSGRDFAGGVVEGAAGVALGATDILRRGTDALRSRQPTETNLFGGQPRTTQPRRDAVIETRPREVVEAEYDQAISLLTEDTSAEAVRRVADLGFELEQIQSQGVQESAQQIWEMTPEEYASSQQAMVVEGVTESPEVSAPALQFAGRAQRATLEAGGALSDAEAALVGELFDRRAEARGISPEQYLQEFEADIARPAPILFREITGGDFPAGKRGFLGYTQEAKAIIGLTRDSDFSTWVHELGHKFRDELSGDVRALAEEYYGVQDGQWDMDTDERFTEDLTTYLMEGTAPTPQMQTFFQRAAEFLTNIYRTLTGRTPISDDIRLVFDEMLGSPQSPLQTIAQARAEPMQTVAQGRVRFQSASGLRPEIRGQIFKEDGTPIELDTKKAKAVIDEMTDTEYAESIAELNEVSSWEQGEQNDAERQAAEIKYLKPDEQADLRKGSGLFPYMSAESNTTPDKKAALTKSTNLKNVDENIAKLDEIQSKHPDPLASEESWNAYMADVWGSSDVPAPPYQLLQQVTDTKAWAAWYSGISDQQIEHVEGGLDLVRSIGEIYDSGEATVEMTGKLFLWSFLSRGVSPFIQEGLFLDVAPDIDEFVAIAARGEWTDETSAQYKAWAEEKLPEISPGRSTKHNFNAFGSMFLRKMSERGPSGQTGMQRLHDLLTDKSIPSKEVRREFFKIADSPGIDNKVVSFTLLASGRTDVLIFDRIQIRNMFNDGRYGRLNVYDGFKTKRPGGKNANVVAGSGFATIMNGVRGLAIYEAIEAKILEKLPELFTLSGRDPADASIGRYHWESWVLGSQQEVDHATLSAFRDYASRPNDWLNGVAVREGRFDTYEYGHEYYRDENGRMWSIVPSSDGAPNMMTPQAHAAFMDVVKNPKTGVVPNDFKVTESEEQPWVDRPEVNRERLDELIRDHSERVRSVDSATGEALRAGSDGARAGGRPGEVRFQSGEGRHEQAVRLAVQSGEFVPDRVLLEYANREWAQEEIQTRQAFREEASQSIVVGETKEEFVQMQLAMDGDRSPSYYANVYATAMSAPEPTVEHLANLWVNNLDETSIQAYFSSPAVIAALDDLPELPPKIVQQIRDGKKLSKAQARQIRDQIYSGQQYEFYVGMQSIIESSDDADLQMLTEAVMPEPDELRVQTVEDVMSENLQISIDQLDERIERAKQRLSRLQRRANAEDPRAMKDAMASARSEARQQIAELRAQYKDALRSAVREARGNNADTVEAYKEALRSAKQEARIESKEQALAFEDALTSAQREAGMQQRELREAMDAALKDARAESRSLVAAVRADERATARRQVAEAKLQLRQQQLMRSTIKKMIKRIMKVPTSSTMLWDYVRQIREIQDGLDPRSFRRGNYGKIRNVLRDQNPQASEADIQQMMSEALGLESLRDMNFQDLQVLYDRIESLRAEGRAALKQKIAERKAQDLEDIATLVGELGGGDPFTEGGTQAAAKEAKTTALNAVKFQTWNMIRITEMLGEKWHDVFWNETNQLHDQELTRKYEKLDRFNELRDRLEIDMRELMNDVTDRITINEAMHIYIAMKNPDSRAAVENNVRPEHLQPALAFVEDNKKYRDFADGLMELFDRETLDRIQEVMIEYANEPMQEVENYFPMRRQDVGGVKFDEELRQDLASRTSAGKTYAWRGFSKNRTHARNADQPAIRLDAVGVALDGLQKQEHFIALGAHIKRLQRLLNHRSLSEAFVRRYGREAFDVMKEWVNRVANPEAHRATDQVGRIIQRLRGNLTVSALMFNMTTIMNNLTGPLLYLPYISKNPVRAARHLVSSMMTAPFSRRMRDFIHTEDPQSRERSLDPTLREIAELRSPTGSKLRQTIEKYGMAMLQAVDDWTVVAGANAVYHARIEEGATHEEAVQAMQDATLRTQPFGQEKDTPSIFTNNTARMFMMFQSALNQIWGMATADLPTMMRDGHAMTASLLVVSMVMTGVLIRSMRRKRLPDSPEEFAKDVASQFIEMIPVIGSDLMGIWDGSPFAGRGVSLTGGAVAAIRGIIKATDDEADSLDRWNAVMRGASEGMRSAGLPGVAVNRMYRMFVNDAGEIQPWALLGGEPEERSDGN